MIWRDRGGKFQDGPGRPTDRRQRDGAAHVMMSARRLRAQINIPIIIIAGAHLAWRSPTHRPTNLNLANFFLPLYSVPWPQMAGGVMGGSLPPSLPPALPLRA